MVLDFGCRYCEGLDDSDALLGPLVNGGRLRVGGLVLVFDFAVVVETTFADVTVLALSPADGADSDDDAGCES